MTWSPYWSILEQTWNNNLDVTFQYKPLPLQIFSLFRHTSTEVVEAVSYNLSDWSLSYAVSWSSCVYFRWSKQRRTECWVWVWHSCEFLGVKYISGRIWDCPGSRKVRPVNWIACCDVVWVVTRGLVFSSRRATRTYTVQYMGSFDSRFETKVLWVEF